MATKSIITLTLILYTFIGFSSSLDSLECSDSIYIVDTGGCENVVMPFETFTEFYVARRNLNILSAKIPELKESMDSLSSLNELKVETFEKELELTNYKLDLVNSNFESCNRLLVEFEIENLKLRKKNKKLSKSGGVKLGIGIGIGTLGTLFLTRL